jgi:hypothetical protein
MGRPTKVKIPICRKKRAEWQTLPEKLSFESSQVSGRILAKTELLPVGFFTLLQVRTQVAPALIIAELKLLGREALLSGDDRRDHADGTAHDHAWNGPTSACGPSLMNPCDPKAMFQVIVGTRQALHVIALKEARRKVVGEVAKRREWPRPAVPEKLSALASDTCVLGSAHEPVPRCAAHHSPGSVPPGAAVHTRAPVGTTARQ